MVPSCMPSGSRSSGPNTQREKRKRMTRKQRTNKALHHSSKSHRRTMQAPLEMACSQCKPTVYRCLQLWWWPCLTFPSLPIFPLSSLLPLPYNCCQASWSPALPLSPAMLVLFAPDGHWLAHWLANCTMHALWVDCWHLIPYPPLHAYLTTQMPLFGSSTIIAPPMPSASPYTMVC